MKEMYRKYKLYWNENKITMRWKCIENNIKRNEKEGRLECEWWNWNENENENYKNENEYEWYWNENETIMKTKCNCGWDNKMKVK